MDIEKLATISYYDGDTEIIVRVGKLPYYAVLVERSPKHDRFLIAPIPLIEGVLFYTKESLKHAMYTWSDFGTYRGLATIYDVPAQWLPVDSEIISVDNHKLFIGGRYIMDMNL